jgi:putative glycosyltransferase (TIGR04372 family)
MNDHTDKFTIFGVLGFRALGDFAQAVMVFAYLKRKFRGSVLLVYAQNDRPYKADLVNLCPDIDDKTFASGPGAPLDWLDFAAGNPNSPPQELIDRGFVDVNLVVSPWMIHAMIENCAAEFVRCFRFSEKLDREVRSRLIAAGVSEDRWLVCTHVRQDGYRYRLPHSPRSVDPEPFFRLADYVIDDLGGQVVCLGSANMKPAPARPHLVDLTKDEGFLLQAYALSRARFAVVTDSGVQHVVNGLGVPFAVTNLEMMGAVLAERRGFPALHDQHLLMSRRFFYKDNVTSGPEGPSKMNRVTDNIVMVDNTVLDLRAITDHMLEMTGDCEGWRETYVEATIEAADSITFPLPGRSPPLNWARPPWWEENPELAEDFKKEIMGPHGYQLHKQGKLSPLF